MPGTAVLRPDDLHTFSRQILTTAGADPGNAAAVARHLVDANLAGHDSHGVIRLPEYVTDIQHGRLRAAAQPVTETTGPTTATVDGQWGFGQVAANTAVATGVALTATTPVALVAIRRCHHLGRLGAYAEQATTAQRILLAAAGGHTPIAAVHGGRDRTLGANPIAAGFPTTGQPVVMDIATTAVAAGKVNVAAARGTLLPDPAIVSTTGQLSQDPADFLTGGALLPFGGHKGSALAVVAELLTAALIGTDDPQAPATPFTRQAALFIIIRADAFAPTDTVTERADDVTRRIHGSTPISESPVLAPGRPEQETRRSRQHDGIRIEQVTVDALTSLAARLGLEPTITGPR